MVEVVCRHDLVLDALVVILQTVLSVVALEHKQILDLELVVLGPPNLQSLVLLLAGLLNF